MNCFKGQDHAGAVRTRGALQAGSCLVRRKHGTDRVLEEHRVLGVALQRQSSEGQCRGQRPLVHQLHLPSRWLLLVP